MFKLPKIFYLFFAISLILTIIWFRGGHLIALGESVIPFYSLENVFKIYGHVWTPISLGFYQTPIASLPFFGYGLIFEFLGFPDFSVQAIVFFTILILMFIGPYLLYNSLFNQFLSKNKKIFLLIASLFYVFNLIALVSVWNRMQYPFMLFYASLPLALYVFAKGLSKKKYSYAIYFGFLLLPFSIVFITISFIELLWGILTTYVIFHILVLRKRKRDDIIFGTFYLFVCIFVWLLFNSWWLLQFTHSIFTLSHDVYSLKGNVETLKGLSEVQGNLSYVFRLMNRDFFIKMEDIWGSFYFTPPFVLISYLVPFLAFLPLLVKKKPIILYFFLGLALIFIYLTKGSAGPFGEVFLFLFSNLKFLEVFRGAFEKFGLVLPLAYAPLIGFSMVYILTRLRKPIFKNLPLFSTVILLFIILVFPFWNRWIFTYFVPPANDVEMGDYIKVPSYYKEADEYLNIDPVDFRTVVLPIENDSVTYKWNGGGFTGVDYTNGLFSKSFVTLSYGIANLDFVVSQFHDVLFKSPEFFTKAMNMVAAKYLMIRNDIDYKYRATMNPKKTQELVEKSNIPNLKFDKNFGKLLFYENLDLLPKIYVAQNAYSSPRDAGWRDIFNLTNFQSKDVILNRGLTKNNDNFISENSRDEFFYPQLIINYDSFPEAHYADALKQFPLYFRFLPGDPFYELILLKEKMAMIFTKDPEYKLFNYLDNSTKRLAELHRVALDRNKEGISEAQKRYIDSLYTLENFIKGNNLFFERNIQYIRYKILSHKAALEHLILTSGDKKLSLRIIETKNKLDNISVELGVLPRYSTTTLKDEERRTIIYRYFLDEDGLYRLMLRDDDLDRWYDVSLSNIAIQLNGDLVNSTIVRRNHFIDIGEFNFKKGLNEIHMSLPDAKDLSVGEKQGKISTLEGTSRVIDVEDFDPLSNYKMTFESRTKGQADMYIRVNSDIDYKNSSSKHEAIMQSTYPYFFSSASSPIDSTNSERWGNFVFPFKTYRGATDLSLSFIINPIDNCPKDLKNPKYFNDCMRKRNSKLINFEYKNLKVERSFTNEIILQKSRPSMKTFEKPLIKYERISPASYKINIENATDPFLLVFSENFDQSWKANFNDGSELSEENHFLVNSYANAWYIDRKGNYQLTLNYFAQKLFDIGKLISVISVSISILIIIFLKFRK